MDLKFECARLPTTPSTGTRTLFDFYEDVLAGAPAPKLGKHVLFDRGGLSGHLSSGAPRPYERPRSAPSHKTGGRPQMTLEVEGLDDAVLNVRAPESSATWYQDVLGMIRDETTPGPGKAARLSVNFGSQKLNPRPVTATQEEWFRAHHATVGSDDLCFLTQSKAGRYITRS